MSTKYMCKCCLVKFANNIKLHIYIQEHYAKKIVKIIFTSTPLCFFSTIISIDTPSTSKASSTPLPAISSTSSSTSPSTWAKFVSKPALSKALSTSVLHYQKPYQKVIKSYLTIDDLFRMFNINPTQKSSITYFKPVGIDRENALMLLKSTRLPNILLLSYKRSRCKCID